MGSRAVFVWTRAINVLSGDNQDTYWKYWRIVVTCTSPGRDICFIDQRTSPKPSWAPPGPGQCRGTLARAQATHIFKPRISHAIYKWLFLANLVAENRDSVLLGWPSVPHSHRQRCTLEIFLQLSCNSHAASDANCRSICLTLQENCWDHRFKVAILICFAW